MNAAWPATKLSRDEWLLQRRGYIGGSDAAAALGLSPYKSPLELCRDKWGEAADLPTRVMERGTVLEDVVAELYRRRTLARTEPGAWCVSTEHPFMAATPDLFDLSADALVQIKTASLWTRHKWGEGDRPTVPEHYLIQCQHEMAVTGARLNILAVLFADESAFRGMVHMHKGGFRPESIADHVEALIEDGMAEFIAPIRVERDDEMIGDIVEGERRFWESYVLPHVCPPDASIPQTSPDILDADDRQTEVLEQLADAKRAQREADERYEEAKVKVIAMIGEHSGIVAPGVVKVSYKAGPATDTVNWEAVARTLAAGLDKPAPEPETWESIAHVLGLEAGDQPYNDAVAAQTTTYQPPRIFRPVFPRAAKAGV